MRFLRLKLLLCCIVSLLASNAFAEVPLKITRNSSTGELEYIKNMRADSIARTKIQSSLETNPETVAKDFLEDVLAQLDAEDQVDTQNLELVSIETDYLGLKHVRFRQLFNGQIPVYGAGIAVHLRKNNDVRSVFLNTLSEGDLNTEPGIDAIDAQKIAAKLYKQSQIYKSSQSIKRRQIKFICTRRYPDIHVIRRSRCFRIRLRRRRKEARPFLAEDAKLLVYSKKFLLRQKADDAKLIWKISLTNSTGLQQDAYFIDASNGEVIEVQPGIQGLNRLIYDFSNPEGLREVNIEHTYSIEGAQVVYTHGRSEGMPARGAVPQGPLFGSTDVDDFYNEMQHLGNYYSSVLQRNGANRLGGLITGSRWVLDFQTAIYTHVDNSAELYEFCEKTHSFAGPHYIAFCSGADASDYDTLGHEYAHFMARNLGIPQNSTPGRTLLDTGESGAVLEAFADFFGEAYERYRTPGHVHDWLITSSAGGGFVRNLAEPTMSHDETFDDNLNVFPGNYADKNFGCDEGANKDQAHLNSVVLSKAFHLMSEGTNSSTYNGCSVQGIGFSKVEQILYYALNVTLNENSSFHNAFEAINDACDALTDYPQFGITAADCQKIIVAMQAVQIDQDGYCQTQNDEVRATCAIADPVEGIPGDYDGNLKVDYQDFLLWQDTEGDSVAAGTGADGDRSGIIDEGDYLIWRSHVGAGVTGAYNGDYNRDGMVTAEDYSLWKEMFGQTVEAGYAADGNGDGKVSLADYTVWRNNLGAGTPPKYPGDYDEDGDVDTDDYNRWKECFGQDAVGICKAADGNKDGKVSLADYTVWRNNLGAGT